MTSRETQPTTTATDPRVSIPSHKHDPIPKEIFREGGDVEDTQTGEPQTDTKDTQTQPAHIDAGLGRVEGQDGTDDEEEEKEEPEDGDDGPPVPRWRIRGPTTHVVSRGNNTNRGRGRG